MRGGLIMHLSSKKCPCIYDCAVYAAIGYAPTLDVQPVVHAEWENVNPVEVPLFRCSACGRTPTVIKTNFCPDCGAKMGG